jgi:hypothetical protein
MSAETPSEVLVDSPLLEKNEIFGAEEIWNP